MKELVNATLQALFALLGATALAGTYTWTPGVSGSWDDTTKWTPNGTPASGDVVQFGGTYNADTTVTVSNTATVAFPSGTSLSGGGKLILQGLSPSARTLTVNNTASDLQITGGPLEFSGLTANIAVPYASNKRFFLTGGGSNGPTRLILSGDSAVTLSGTMLLLSGDNNTQGSRVEINDSASLAMSGAEMQPGRGQNTWGGVVQRGGAVNAGAVKFGYNANSFGTWEMFEGTNTFSGDTWLSYNGGNATNAAGAASLYVHGGLLSLGGNMHFGYWGRSEAFIDGGKVSFNGQKLNLVNRASDLADLPSVLTIAKNAVVTAKKIYPYAEYSSYSGQSRAMVNLNGDGLLSLADTFMVNASGTTRATLSFNGGTLERVTGSPDSDANKNLLKGVDAVVYPGGGKLKARTSTGAVSGMTLNNAKFRKAGGWGVASIAVTSGGSGYLLPPLVDITGGSGSNATAVAQINYETRQVTNVVVTCPGEGYAPGDTLAVSFVVPSKPVVTAATATATLAENTAGTLRIVDGSTVSLGATFRYDGDFAMDTETHVPITGNITLGGTSEFKGLDVRDNAALVFAGPATARDADLKGLGKIVITEGGSLAVSGYASLRGTVEVARASTTPLMTAGSCSFNPDTGSSYVATLVPADGLRATEPIPVIAVSGTLVGSPVLGGAIADNWRLKTTTQNGVTTLWLAPVAPTTIVLR